MSPYEEASAFCRSILAVEDVYSHGSFFNSAVEKDGLPVLAIIGTTIV